MMLRYLYDTALDNFDRSEKQTCLKLQKLNHNLFNIPDPILLNVFCLLSFLKCKRNVYCIFSVVFVIKIYYSPQYDIIIHIQHLFVQ